MIFGHIRKYVIRATPKATQKKHFLLLPFCFLSELVVKKWREREGDTKSGLCEMGLVTVFRQHGSKDGGMWGAELSLCVYVEGSAYLLANSGVSCQAPVT